MKLDMGFGMFGQVLPIVSQQEWMAYERAPSIKKEKNILPPKPSQEASSQKIQHQKSGEAEQDKATTDALKSILRRPEKEGAGKSYHGSDSN